MKKNITSLLLIIALTGCSKSSNEYTITGLVLDADAKTPLAGAKVYARNVGNLPTDSSITDAAGRTSFTFKKGDHRLVFAVSKTGYIPSNNFISIQPGTYENRTDTSYLARPSFVNLTIHKSGTYLTGDSVYVKGKGYYSPGTFSPFAFVGLTRDIANAPDKIINLPGFYANPGYSKMYFQWDIIRAGAIVSSHEDSTEMIQFGTKNFTLNY